MNYRSPTSLHALPHLGVVLVAGPDARAFLQGQISFDMDRFESGRMELASCNSAQGRVQAVLWIVERAEGFVLILPAALLESMILRLRKYVLRAKVSISAASLVVAGTDNDIQLDSERAHIESEGVSFIRWPGTLPRLLMLAPPSPTSLTTDETFLRAWRLEDIRAGLPQVYVTTHELFVAQMLNIDLLGGVGFEKGCYTGQEIIARTHFRGTVKRRMFRFAASCTPPSPAVRIVANGAHAGDVVDAAATSDGCELLAVISVAQIDSALELDAISGSALRRLPLPYAIT
jgi:folate-binding protein YgfZ